MGAEFMAAIAVAGIEIVAPRRGRRVVEQRLFDGKTDIDDVIGWPDLELLDALRLAVIQNQIEVSSSLLGTIDGAIPVSRIPRTEQETEAKPRDFVPSA